MIFVFGSNLAGIHGGGAAKLACNRYGAQLGVGVGPTGKSYAIPTKNNNIHTMPLDQIKPYVDDFLEYADARRGTLFNVTRIGCGLAGYTDDDIRPMFAGAPRNVLLPPDWSEALGLPCHLMEIGPTTPSYCLNEGEVMHEMGSRGWILYLATPIPNDLATLIRDALTDFVSARTNKRPYENGNALLALVRQYIDSRYGEAGKHKESAVMGRILAARKIAALADEIAELVESRIDSVNPFN